MNDKKAEAVTENWEWENLGQTSRNQVHVIVWRLNPGRAYPEFVA